MNMILNTDSYKPGHWLQYPPQTQQVYSYVEARGPVGKEVLFLGPQAFIKEYLLKPVTMADIIEAEDILPAHGVPFNKEGWLRLLNKRGGYFPLEIKAVPEGTMVPTSNILTSVVNTDPEFFWLTSYIETAYLRAVWYPTSVATTSKEIKNLILKYLKETGDPSLIDFKLHDFGARGVSSFESAGIGGMAHLVNFMGTDTISGIMFARKYYNADMPGFSIPASEHSTMTTWGGRNGEVDAMNNMLDQFAKPGSLVACVSDSYDIYNATENLWGSELRQKILDSGATLVVRPDSGDATTVPIEVVKLLDSKFGSEVNEKGFKVLNPAVRVIQGDNIEYKTIDAILNNLKNAGYSADNIAFGMGGALLQHPNRDTYQFAMKASAILINNEWRDVYKDPIITSKKDFQKKSKRGKLGLFKDSAGGYFTARENINPGNENVLKTIFKDGELLNEVDFNTVRNNSNC